MTTNLRALASASAAERDREYDVEHARPRPPAPPRYSAQTTSAAPARQAPSAPAAQRSAAATPAQARGRARDARDARDSREAKTGGDAGKARPARTRGGVGARDDHDRDDACLQGAAADGLDGRRSGGGDPDNGAGSEDGTGIGVPVGESAADRAAAGAGALSSMADDAALDDALTGLHDQQGIFELLLPGGQSLGVVVQSSASGVDFLLSAPGGMLEQRLRQNKMELERRLERRMHKEVRIALL